MKIKRKLSLIEVILIVAIFAFGIAILNPVFETVNHRAPITSTVSNAKQLTLGFLMYSADYDEKPPFVDPFEFGDDPCGPYLKNEDMHAIPYPPHAEERLPGKTDFRFQYVLNQKTTQNGHPVRLILGPILEEKDYSQTIVLTGNLNDKEGNEVIVAGFSDGHAKKYEKSQLKAIMPPFGDFPSLFSLEDLLYALPEETKPPEFWAVPYEDVERYAKWAREPRK